MPMKGSRGTALPKLNLSTKSDGDQRHAPAVLPQGQTAGILCTRGWVGPGGSWIGPENPAPIGDRNPFRPAHT
jgi:hypothetical protein